jgi:hypothetical protein
MLQNCWDGICMADICCSRERSSQATPCEPRTLWNAQPGYALRAAHSKSHFLIAAFAIPDHSSNSPACAGGHYTPHSAQCHSLLERDEHAKASVGRQCGHACREAGFVNEQVLADALEPIDCFCQLIGIVPEASCSRHVLVCSFYGNAFPHFELKST